MIESIGLAATQFAIEYVGQQRLDWRKRQRLTSAYRQSAEEIINLCVQEGYPARSQVWNSVVNLLRSEEKARQVARWYIQHQIRPNELQDMAKNDPVVGHFIKEFIVRLNERRAGLLSLDLANLADIISERVVLLLDQAKSETPQPIGRTTCWTDRPPSLGENSELVQANQWSQPTQPASSSSGHQRTVPFLAPPRPSYNLVGRDNLLRDLKQRLFAGGNLALSALHGLPGVGKTALAIELAYSRDVLEYFQDGILWAGLGRNFGRDKSDILSRLGVWGMALGIPSDQMSNLTDISAWEGAIHGAIGLRRMLLVIDDARQTDIAEHFKLGGPNCAHLVTTRLPEVALRFASEATIVHELSEADGLTLLARLAPRVVEAEPDEALELERVVGGLPLALILMGKYLQIEAGSGQPRRLRAALDRLQRAEERLQLDESQAPLERHPSLPAGTKISLRAVIGISDEALDEEVRSTFRAIAVFPSKPNTFSEEAACAVSESPTKALDTLYDYGLLEASGPGRYTLHQAIQEYAKANLTDYAPYERMGKFFSNLLAPYQKPYVHFDKSALASIGPEEENSKASLKWYQEQGMWDEYIPLALGLCSYVGYISRWQEEIESGKRAAEAAEKIGDNLAAAHVYCHVLPWPMWMRGEYQQARESCQVGIAAAQKLISEDQQIYLSLANHNLYRAALQECQTTNDRNLIAQLLKEMKLYDDQCLEFAEQTEGTDLFETLLGLAYSNKGFTSLKVGDYPEAESWFTKRLELVRKTNNLIQIASRSVDVALAVIGQKRYDRAKELLVKAQMIVEDCKRDDLSAEILFNLARIEREKGDVAAAQAMEVKAQQLWKELGFMRDPFAYILDKRESHNIEKHLTT